MKKEDYISVKAFADKFDISERTARNYCAEPSLNKGISVVFDEIPPLFHEIPPLFNGTTPSAEDFFSKRYIIFRNNGCNCY